MKGVVRVIQVDSVRQESLKRVLGSVGVNWSAAAHITATVSLGRAILRNSSGALAVPIATLIELISMQGYPGHYALEVDGFPGPAVLHGVDGYAEYARQVSLWTSRASGVRMRIGLEVGDALRRYRREVSWGGQIGRAVLESTRDFTRTIHALAASGVDPASISPVGDVAIWAVQAWHWVEQQRPVVASLRNDLWIDRDEFEVGATERARDLHHRIRRALTAVFGEHRGSLTIVYHGFYFYTPPQWALFQLLRRMDGIEQIFIVHDDGRNPAFETWRRFFQPKWLMPAPQAVHTGATAGAGAALLGAALQGERIEAPTSASAVRILECRSPSEFVRFVAQAQARSEQDAARGAAQSPRLYAADKPVIKRYCARLGVDPGGGAVDLAQLPVGAFLLRLHDCFDADGEGNITVTLDSEALTDIVGSGFLRVDGAPVVNASLQSALMRAMPFFRGCRSCAQWNTRAAALEELVRTHVTRHGERFSWQDDRERIAAAAANNFRVVPWGDLSALETKGIRHAVEAATALLAELAGRERVKLERHFGFIRRELERGMTDLPREERERIEARLSGFGVALDMEVDVEGLVDVVSLLLGRRVDFDAFGEEDEVQESGIRPLRNIDELGFCRAPGDLHLANLADGAFPAAAQSIGWPFTREDLEGSPAAALEILEARAEHAALGDLYLLWLALDGVGERSEIVLSWISDVGGEPRSSSSVLAMLMQPPVLRWDAVMARAGGVAISHVTSGAEGSPLFESPRPDDVDVPDEQLAIALRRINRRALASAHVCPRRFALQWALGPSAAFMQEHHHKMLYGNVLGAFERGDSIVPRDACESAWQHLTPGERASSLTNRRVRPDGAWRDWLLTLRGSRGGSDADSRAYECAARGGPLPGAMAVRGEPTKTLPLPPEGVAVNRELCMNCPVRPRCSVAQSDPD